MKLKLKLRNPTVSFNIDLEAERQTFKHLKDDVSAILSSQIFVFEGSIPFDISLNGKDAINGGEETNLKDLEIVSGDILHILIESDTQKNLIPLQNASNRSEMERKSEKVEGNEEEKIINKYLNEPMLCRESTEVSIPSSLRREFERNEATETIHDVLTVVLHVLMTEAGFVSRERSKTPGGIYSLVYRHQNCNEFTCKLVCIPMEWILIVNGIVVADKNEGSKVLAKCDLDCNRYIVTKPTYKDIDPIHVYKNLAQLSHCFKDSVVYPLQMFLQSDMGVLTGMLALPTEVKLLILRFLNIRGLLAVSSVCTELNQIANEPTLWKKLFYRDFKNKVASVHQTYAEINWKKEYRQVYLLELQTLRTRSANRMKYSPYDPLLPHRNPFRWQPQPVGGDYDLYPPIYPGGPVFQPAPRPRIDPGFPQMPQNPFSRNRRPPPDGNRNPFAFFENQMYFI